jgi:hypothetical protein
MANMRAGENRKSFPCASGMAHLLDFERML